MAFHSSRSAGKAPRKGRLSILSAAAAITLALTGCGGGLLSQDEGGDGGGDQSSEPIVLGMLTPLSGSSAAVGPYMQNGAQLAVDEINDKGGVNGRKLELRVEDEACDAKSAVAGANKLVTAGVDISVGGYCSGATLPTLPIFEKADIPMIIPAANSNELVDQNKQNVFLINGTGTQQADAALAFIKSQGDKKVGLMDDNTSYSTNITDLTAELLKEGGDPGLSGRESVTAGESDYSANVNSILSGNPDIVYWTGYYQEGGLIIRQLRQAGYKGDLMVADGSVDNKLIEIAGKSNAEGVYATMTQTPDTLAGAEDWIKDYKAKFNAEPGPYSTQSYDAVRLAAEAVRVAGSTEGEKVISALEGIDGFQMFSGPLNFTPEHTLSSGGFQILEVKDGQFVLKDELK